MKLVIDGSGTTCTVIVAGVPPLTEVAVSVIGVCVTMPAGAVRWPVASMLPAEVCQLTDVLTDPVTAAVYVAVRPEVTYAGPEMPVTATGCRPIETVC